MLRLPIYGFAKRVDDSVARAMAFLQDREDCTIKGHVSPPPKPSQKPKR